ncbi:MAG: Stp1/IreP family PP2C-type Ser/Thr phosphatase [Tepidanaerobacteraceae bacterium]|jgi:protein phosphatase|nr:Stp1/IreP family PP2C-type Ser/Thr phosphatase [Tepidanaerobacteraceae bacterium]
MIFAARTSVGRVRSNNEDAFYVPPANGSCCSLFIVADGMGGHRGGEVASRMAVKEVSEYITTRFSDDLDEDKIRSMINDSIAEANKKILISAMENEEWAGMGTTLTLALFFRKKIFIGHVGDSRAYLIRNNDIVQLTRDHSLVWQLMEEGRLTMDETRTHPMKNIITRALGTETILEPDFLEYDLEKEDIIIICSDGLTNMLEDYEIKNIVCGHDIETAVDILVQKANLHGGLDNITVELIKAD